MQKDDSMFSHDKDEGTRQEHQRRHQDLSPDIFLLLVTSGETICMTQT